MASAMTLTAMACVVRAKAPALESIDHVMELLNELLDMSVLLSLEQAVVYCDARLFDRVYHRVFQTRQAMDPCLVDVSIGRAMERAVWDNQLNIVQRIHALYPQRLPVRLLPLAAETGDLPMFQWLITHRTDDFCAPRGQQDGKYTSCDQLGCCLHDASVGAIRNKHLQIVRWLYENGYHGQLNWMYGAGDMAASAGDLEMVKWFHALPLPPSHSAFTTSAIDAAARGGHGQVVAFLMANRLEVFTSAAVHGAFLGGHDEILSTLCIDRTSKEGQVKYEVGRWAYEAAERGRLDLLQMDEYKKNYSMSDPSAMVTAFFHGHLDVLQWLVETYQCPFPTYAITEAARLGHLNLKHLDLLKWLHVSGHGDNVWHANVMDAVAGSGHLELVQWFHFNRNEGCSVAAMANAASAGHLHVVQWLHVHRTEGCSTKAMDRAAAGGHLAVIQWLHANRTEGCSTDAMANAAAFNHHHVVQWLQKNRTEGCTTCAMDEAACRGQLEMVMWFHTHRTEGCSTLAMDLAPLPVVKWLHRNRTEGCTTIAMDRAAGRGDTEMLTFLHENRMEGCSAAAAVQAVTKGHLYIVQWLQERYPCVFDWPRVEETARRWKRDHIIAWIEASQQGINDSLRSSR